MRQEEKKRLYSVNAWYHSVQSPLSSVSSTKPQGLKRKKVEIHLSFDMGVKFGLSLQGISTG
jgi:hypothetical protein